MDCIQQDFMNRQLAVIFSNMRIIRDIMGDIELRLEEIEYELEEPVEFTRRSFGVTDLPYEARPKYCMCDDCWGVRKNECDCPDCREDASYRMD